MAFKQSGDHITAIGNITGISVNVNTQGGDSRVGYTIKQIHFHLIKKTTSIRANLSTGPDIILIHTLKQCAIYNRQGDIWFYNS